MRRCFDVASRLALNRAGAVWRARGARPLATAPAAARTSATLAPPKAPRIVPLPWSQPGPGKRRERQSSPVRSKTDRRPRGETEIGRCGGLSVWLTREFGREIAVFHCIEVRGAHMRLLWEANVGIDEEEARVRARAIHSLLYAAGEHWRSELQKIEPVRRSA